MSDNTAERDDALMSQESIERANRLAACEDLPTEEERAKCNADETKKLQRKNKLKGMKDGALVGGLAVLAFLIVLGISIYVRRRRRAKTGGMLSA